MSRELAIAVQQRLVALGFKLGDTGPNRDGVDGVLGDVSLRAALAALPVAPAAAEPIAVQPGTRALAWGNVVDADFREGVYWIARQFEWGPQGPSDLMACMAWESDESFSPKKTNYAGSGAVGLIQFMPATAEALGTTTAALAAMTPVRQLGYVYLYFKQFSKIRGPNVTLSDLYMAILLPKYIGQPEDAVLFSGGVAYRQNSGLDANRDGRVTKLEASAKVLQKLQKGMQPPYVWAGA